VGGFVGGLTGSVAERLKAGRNKNQECEEREHNHREPAREPQLTCIHRW
jgi:hypothetical protein